ncbi:MAG: hypothetical protein K940chlam3_00068 [Chlamydiae bacterium]|nr:hypothetical protein [Chlamydiota bacterium]
MRLLKYLTLFTLSAVLLTITPSYSKPLGCSRDSFHNACDQRDFEAVQEYVNSKRTIPLEEKDCNLSISGDIRFDWASILEKINCEKFRGHHGIARQDQSNGNITIVPPIGGPPGPDQGGGLSGQGIPFSTSTFEVELNLYLDYVCDRSWGVAWIQFDNDAGIWQSNKTCQEDPQGLFGSGCCEGLCLRKAYMGYNLFVDGCSRFDVELGRRPLYTVFDSRVQFQSNFDGLLLKYARNAGKYGDFYGYGGVFLVDERSNHGAWIVEVGLLAPCDKGIDLRYSYIDWQTIMSHDTNRCDTAWPVGASFRVSQWTLAYNFCIPSMCIPGKAYGALIYNHDTRNLTELSINRHLNLAYYFGILFGQVCHEGDWAFDICYQYVEPYAVPDQDVSGIGRNGRNLLMQTMTADGRGFTNYAGWRFELLYAITDNFSLDGSFEYSREIYANIFGFQSLLTNTPSGPINYSKFEVEAIYAF